MMPLNEYKTAFSDLVYDITREDVYDLDFKDILKLVNSLICDKKEKELLRILKTHFTEYIDPIKPFKVK